MALSVLAHGCAGFKSRGFGFWWRDLCTGQNFQSLMLLMLRMMV